MIKYKKCDKNEFNDKVLPLVKMAHSYFAELYAMYGIKYGAFGEDELKNDVSIRATVPYAAYDGENAVACVLASDSKWAFNSITIEYLYVKEAYRHRGIATALLDFVFKDLEKTFCETYAPKRLIFNCIEGNNAAKSLYRKLGMLKKPFEVFYDITHKVGDWTRWGDWGLDIKPTGNPQESRKGKKRVGSFQKGDWRHCMQADPYNNGELRSYVCYDEPHNEQDDEWGERFPPDFCICGCGRTMLWNNHANADLIAAAPKMYNLLAELLEITTDIETREKIEAVLDAADGLMCTEAQLIPDNAIL